MDHSLKLWRLDTEAIEKAIKDSYTFGTATAAAATKTSGGGVNNCRPFATVHDNFPDFSTRGWYF
jgi:hypothetical protein